MNVRSVHIWGFYDEAGGRRLPDGGAPSELTVYDHARLVEANITHFGGEVISHAAWYEMGGPLVSVAFEAPERDDGTADRMWHVISEPREPWRDPTATPPMREPITEEQP